MVLVIPNVTYLSSPASLDAEDVRIQCVLPALLALVRSFRSNVSSDFTPVLCAFLVENECLSETVVLV